MRAESVAKSIQMLKGILGGKTSVAIAHESVLSRSAVEQRVKALARDLQTVVGVERVDENDTRAATRLEAAEGVQMKSVTLSERLYVPEPFHEEHRREIAERRRSKLAVLRSPENDVQFKMALVLGEYKGEEVSPLGRKVWLKHMPDAPLFINAKTWERIERTYGNLLEARYADTTTKQRVVICALIYVKREHTYRIDTASFMLTTEHWIPIEGTHEVDLIEALTHQKRRFMEPLRYDARNAVSFPNVLLLDTGAKPTALHVVSSSLDARDRVAKEKALKALGDTGWVWKTDKGMPPLPAGPLRTNERGNRPASSVTESEKSSSCPGSEVLENESSWRNGRCNELSCSELDLPDAVRSD